MNSNVKTPHCSHHSSPTKKKKNSPKDQRNFDHFPFAIAWVRLNEFIFSCYMPFFIQFWLALRFFFFYSIVIVYDWKRAVERLLNHRTKKNRKMLFFLLLFRKINLSYFSGCCIFVQFLHLCRIRAEKCCNAFGSNANRIPASFHIFFVASCRKLAQKFCASVELIGFQSFPLLA